MHSRAKRRARNGSHLGLFEQEEGHVVRILQGLPFKRFAEQRAHIWEHVERAHGLVDLESWHLAESIDHEGPTSAERRHHVACHAGVGFKRGCGRSLGDARRGRRELTLDFGARGCNPLGGTDVPQTPARHGESLGNPVDHRALPHAWLGGHARVLVGEVDELVDLIADSDDAVVLAEDVCQAAVSSWV